MTNELKCILDKQFAMLKMFCLSNYAITMQLVVNSNLLMNCYGTVNMFNKNTTLSKRLAKAFPITYNTQKDGCFQLFSADTDNISWWSVISTLHCL